MPAILGHNKISHYYSPPVLIDFEHGIVELDLYKRIEGVAGVKKRFVIRRK